MTEEHSHQERNHRKVRQGTVVSSAGDKTVVVQINERKPHPIYGKMMTRSKKFHAHDERNEAGVGDTVQIMETRPLSKLKRWRLLEIVEKAK
jgi:small subunit ribosomal protein S17